MFGRFVSVTIPAVALVAFAAGPPAGPDPATPGPSSAQNAPLDQPVEPPPTTLPPWINPEVTSSPEPLKAVADDVTFPPTDVDTSRTQDVAVRNINTNESITVVEVELDGDGEFHIRSDRCTGPLGPGATCFVSVVFTSSTPGLFRARLIVRTSADESSAELTAQALAASTSVVPPTTGPPLPVDPPAGTSEAPDGSAPPGDPTPTTLPVVPGRKEQRFRECEEHARDADVEYSPALEMTVGVASLVEVSITTASASLTVTTPATTAAPTTIERAVLTCFVEAELSGTNFQIDDPVQDGAFLDSGRVHWSWYVTPISSGPHRLTLRVTPKHDTGAARELGTPRTFRTSITVIAASQSNFQAVTDDAESLLDHPFVRGIPLVASLVGVLYAAWRWLLGRSWPWRRTPADTVVDQERPAAPGGT